MILLRKVADHISNLFNMDVNIDWYVLADMNKYNEIQL